MNNTAETLRAELAAEQKEIKIDVALTVVTLVGLLGGVVVPWLQLPPYYAVILFVIAFLAGGFRAAVEAFGNLLKGKLDIDLLMVLAALAAAGVDQARDGAILLFLFSLSETLQQYAMGNTKRAVVSLMKLRPDEANLELADGQTERVKVEALMIGQIIMVKPGERLPIDGTIIRGMSAVDQSPVTGESVPVDKNPNDLVFAGSVNGYGVLAVRVEKVASQSTLARMIDLVASAQAERSPSERFSEWFGSRYTFVVLIGSITALGVFLVIHIPVAEALYKAATLLVVASPCAIVISVPAAVLSALAAAARKGMLFKGGAALEEFGTVDTIAFDKTGTLTTGKMSVSSVVPFGMREEAFLQIAASLEVQSEHPLARSIVDYAATKKILPGEVTDVVAIPGKGIKATLAGVAYWAGNRRLLDESGLKLSTIEREALEALEAAGKTSIIFGTADQVIGCIGIADTIRDTAVEALVLLRSAGIKRIVMLTGDHSSVAEAIGASLGIVPADIYAGLMPEDKVAIIKTLRDTGKVAFVGDGVNDAAALATAHVGIAMGAAGTDVALEAADVALLSDDMRKMTTALRLAKQTNRIIKQNLVFALGILAVMVVITIFWHLPLPLGVVGHEGGTLLVVMNGLRLLMTNL
jgi:heavy metal translocating P-type ATPase